MLRGIVDKMEKQNSYRDDLKCPCLIKEWYGTITNKKKIRQSQTLYVQVDT